MATDVEIRPAQPTDHPILVAVMDEWWGRPISGILPRLFLDHFCTTSFVAASGDEVVGFLVGFPSPARPDEAYVHAIAVAPGRRVAGLARVLYQRFFDAALADGRPVIRAVTSPVNERSIAFHRRIGFTVSEPIADYDGPGQDRVTFRLDLRAPAC
ncbi:GNAT family N-acetyltransferase [Pseudonocardia nigra]|uniref:GNAT family N-acetyltransferase n=1 Tax=Pseudonocardia nigra TaxID=1921578 RepID=UPI0027E32AC0|nr:GNAT family N-acetyltransferase [Pseudonocardia nigra]